MSKLWTTMAFYALVSYFLGPFLGKKWRDDLSGVQTGMLGGILLSVLLWFWKGRNYISSVPVSDVI